MLLNSHESIVFQNGRDTSRLRTLAYEICINSGQWHVDAFIDATFEFYWYLVLDHHSSTFEDQTIVTNIFHVKKLFYYINSHPKVKRN